MFKARRKRSAFIKFHKKTIPETYRNILLDKTKDKSWRRLLRSVGYASPELLASYYEYFNSNSYPEITISDHYTQQEELMTIALGFSNVSTLVAFRSVHPKRLSQVNRDYVFLSLVSTVWNDIMDQREERIAMQELFALDALEQCYNVIKNTSDNVQAGLEIVGFTGVQITLDQPSDKSFVVLANDEGTAFIGSPTIDSSPGQALQLWNAMGGYFCHQCQMNHYVRTNLESFSTTDFPKQVLDHFLRAKKSLEQLEEHQANHPGQDLE